MPGRCFSSSRLLTDGRILPSRSVASMLRLAKSESPGLTAGPSMQPSQLSASMMSGAASPASMAASRRSSARRPRTTHTSEDVMSRDARVERG